MNLINEIKPVTSSAVLSDCTLLNPSLTVITVTVYFSPAVREEQSHVTGGVHVTVPRLLVEVFGSQVTLKLSQLPGASVTLTVRVVSVLAVTSTPVASASAIRNKITQLFLKQIQAQQCAFS